MLSINGLFSIVAQHDFLRREDLSCLVNKKSCEILSICLAFYLGEVVVDKIVGSCLGIWTKNIVHITLRYIVYCKLYSGV